MQRRHPKITNSLLSFCTDTKSSQLYEHTRSQSQGWDKTRLFPSLQLPSIFFSCQTLGPGTCYSGFPHQNKQYHDLFLLLTPHWKGERAEGKHVLQWLPRDTDTPTFFLFLLKKKYVLKASRAQTLCLHWSPISQKAATRPLFWRLGGLQMVGSFLPDRRAWL